MHKKRIIASLIIKNGIVVQSLGFSRYLPVGRPEIATEFLDAWGVDEIVLIDIDATRQNRGPDVNLVKRIVKKLRVPLTVGGGITRIEDIHALIQAGADKVAINHMLEDGRMIKEAASVFGRQCLIGVVDAVYRDQTYVVFDYLKKRPMNISVADRVEELQDMGIGEILLQSVDRDGSYMGFDIDLYKHVENKLNIPVIAMGGARCAKDFHVLFSQTAIQAAAAGNIFHFSEHAVSKLKSRLYLDFEVRNAAKSNYGHMKMDLNDRVLKQSDEVLSELIFEHIINEKI